MTGERTYDDDPMVGTTTAAYADSIDPWLFATDDYEHGVATIRYTFERTGTVSVRALPERNPRSVFDALDEVLSRGGCK